MEEKTKLNKIKEQYQGLSIIDKIKFHAFLTEQDKKRKRELDVLKRKIVSDFEANTKLATDYIRKILRYH